MNWEVETVEGLTEIARKIVAETSDIPLILLKGQMGAGKTTLTKSICQQLGVQDEVSSPTFTLVNEYLDESGNTIYHCDLYRLEDAEEAFDAGLEDRIYGKDKCLIEWPDIIEDHLPEKFAVVKIESIDAGRNISLIKHG